MTKLEEIQAKIIELTERRYAELMKFTTELVGDYRQLYEKTQGKPNETCACPEPPCSSEHKGCPVHGP